MSFPPATEMFQFAGFASLTYGFSQGYPHGWVAPFGDPGINDRSHLPRAFRSVPRPSSPLSAKASTRCPYFTRSMKTAAHRGKTPLARRPHVKTLLPDTPSGLKPTACPPRSHYNSLHNLNNVSTPVFPKRISPSALRTLGGLSGTRRRDARTAAFVENQDRYRAVISDRVAISASRHPERR